MEKSYYLNICKSHISGGEIRFYDGWLGVTLDNPAEHTGAQLLPGLIEETALGLPVLVHADPRVYPPRPKPALAPVSSGGGGNDDDEASERPGGAGGAMQHLSQSQSHFRERPRGRPAKSCDNPMVGQGVISQELLKIQLVAFLLAQGNHTYFALSEGWTDVQQPRIDKQRPLEQWAWQPQYDVRYGAPLGPAVVTNLTAAMGGGGDQLYRRELELDRCRSQHFYSIQRASYSRPELFLRNGAGEAWRPNQGNVAWVHGTTSLPAGKRALRFNGVSPAVIQTAADDILGGWNRTSKSYPAGHPCAGDPAPFAGLCECNPLRSAVA
eukprot:SAG31_NODE_1480_length_8180_cov_5.458978_3_plen_325_part_00